MRESGMSDLNLHRRRQNELFDVRGVLGRELGLLCDEERE